MLWKEYDFCRLVGWVYLKFAVSKTGYFCNKSIPTCVSSVPDHRNFSILAGSLMLSFSEQPQKYQDDFWRDMYSCSFKMLLTNFKLKPGQNKKGQKNFQLYRFLNTFLQLAADKKYSKNKAAVNFQPFLFCDDFSNFWRAWHYCFL